MSEPSEDNGVSLAGTGTDLLSTDIPDALPSPALAQLTKDVLDDVFYNIIYDIVAKVHREEKVARGVSAAVQIRKLAEEQTSIEAANTNDAANGTVEANDTATAKPIPKIETEAATLEDGKVHLKGNPLDTVSEIICPDCRLPRLLYPIFGEGSRPIPDPSKEYCRKRPPMRIDKRDVHGRPYAIEKATKKKKNAPASPIPSPPSSPSSTPAAASLKQLPGRNYVPSVKCPNCPRYFFLTRIAQHLDRCMGLTVRQASRNRTPMDSTASTPAPTGLSLSQNGTGPAGIAVKKRAREGDDEAGSGGPKKKKKPPVGPSKLKTAASANAVKAGKKE